MRLLNENGEISVLKENVCLCRSHLSMQEQSMDVEVAELNGLQISKEAAIVKAPSVDEAESVSEDSSLAEASMVAKEPRFAASRDAEFSSAAECMAEVSRVAEDSSFEVASIIAEVLSANQSPPLAITQPSSRDIVTHGNAESQGVVQRSIQMSVINIGRLIGKEASQICRL